MVGKERYLVTGGSGYFGSCLVDAIVTRGFSARVFDLLPMKANFEEVDFIGGDILDRNALHVACEDISTVFHCVALVPLEKNRKKLWEVNFEGTKNLLDVCIERKSKKVVFLSSSAVYGVPSSNPVDEMSPTSPQEDYGRTKLAAEELCGQYAGRGLDITVIRPRTILGHGRLGIMQILFEWIFRGRNIPVLGKGENLYQFIHADDLADACIKAAGRPGNAVFNIGATEFGTMRETLEGLIDHAGSISKIVNIPIKPAEVLMDLTTTLGLSPLAPYLALMYGRSLYFDTTRARSDLGWSSRYSNLQMLCQSYSWYIQNRQKTLELDRSQSHHSGPVKQGILDLLSRIW